MVFCAGRRIRLGRDRDEAEERCRRPIAHKNAHRGRGRVIFIGPRAQAILGPYIADTVADPTEPLFSPRRAGEEWIAKRQRLRKSKAQPPQAGRKKTSPKVSPGRTYTRNSYRQAIARAAKKAGVPHWFPYQLRHTAATKIRHEHGLEGAQVALGHSRADVTQIYAERDARLGEEIARKMG